MPPSNQEAKTILILPAFLQLGNMVALACVEGHFLRTIFAPDFFFFPAGGQEGMDFWKGGAAQRVRREYVERQAHMIQ